jgi:hypothetical protein
MAWTTTDNPSNQVIPTLGDPNITEEEEVRDYLVYWQNFFTTFFNKIRKSLGGEGFSNDFLGINSVLPENFKPQKRRVPTNVTVNTAFGSSGITVASTNITTTFSNAFVELKASAVWGDSNPSGLIHFSIEKSTSDSFATYSTIGSAYNSLPFYPFSWQHVNVSAVDTVPSASTVYYRARMYCERIGANGCPPNNGAAFVVQNSQIQNYIQYEVTQQPTA